MAAIVRLRNVSGAVAASEASASAVVVIAMPPLPDVPRRLPDETCEACFDWWASSSSQEPMSRDAVRLNRPLLLKRCTAAAPTVEVSAANAAEGVGRGRPVLPAEPGAEGEPLEPSPLLCSCGRCLR